MGGRTPESTTGSNPSPRMRSRLAGRILAVLVLTASAVAISATTAHFLVERQWRREAAERHWLTQAQLGAAHMSHARISGEGRLVVDAELESDFEAWSNAVMAECGAVATALVSADGEVLASWPRSVAVDDLVPRPRHGSREYLETAPAGSVGAAFPHLSVALAPIRDTSVAYACVVADITPASVWSSHQFKAFAAAVVGLASLVVVVARFHLRRQVLLPLSRLGTQLALARRSRSAPGQSVGGDELGALVRGIHELGEELDTAHRRASRLEQTFDVVVERETRKFSRMLQHAQRNAEIDALTRLANRRFIEERLEGLVSEQRERGVNLAIVMFDVDNFKTLNDSEGHSIGDAVLRFVGELLRASLRESDVGIRYGGDEFAIVFVDISDREAYAIAERVIRLFARQIPAMGVKTPVTLSAGVASLRDVGASSGAELMAKADEALYRSKRGGKNLVAIAV
jgi:diguanylate cyclase (GGDEF)-like protein